MYLPRKPWFAVAAALLSMAGFGVADAQIVTNGDFSGGTGGTFASGSATTSNSVPAGWIGFATATSSLNASGGNVIFNGGNTVPGSYVQQTVSVNSYLWYTLQWDHQDGPGSFPERAVSTLQIWNGPTATGSPDLGDRAVRYPTLAIPQVFQADSGQATLRFGDAGSNTTSNDVQIDNISVVLANGAVNVAPSLGTATASSTHGSFGVNPQSAVDGSSNFSDGLTNFHSDNADTAGATWRLDFADPLGLVSRVEVQSRTGFDSRNGDFLDLIDSMGGIIDTLNVTDGPLFFEDGDWFDVKAIEIRNGPANTQPLNLAEVRVFAEFDNGVAVVAPEPASMAIWSLLSIALCYGFARVRGRK